MLDRSFNIAVLQACNRVLPNGFDVSEQAPSDYDSLLSHYQETGRVLVWSGASDQTIFGDCEVNYAFRAWHDSRHIALDLDFSLTGEAKVCFAQCRDVRAIFGNCQAQKRFARYLGAEVIGQALYQEYNGGFPIDQIGFVRAYLDNAKCAVYHGAFGVC